MTSKNSSLSGHDDLAVTAFIKMESLEPEEAEDTNAEAVEAGEVALRDIFHCSLTITTTDRRVLFTLLNWLAQFFQKKITQPLRIKRIFTVDFKKSEDCEFLQTN